MMKRITSVCLPRLPAKARLGNRFCDNQRHDVQTRGGVPASAASFDWTLELNFGFGCRAKRARICGVLPLNLACLWPTMPIRPRKTVFSILLLLLTPQLIHADPPREAEIEELFQNLGAGEFAVRERAGDRLVEMGTEAIPILRELAAQSEDPEVTLRASRIIKQVTEGDMAGKIDTFLAGGQADFPGWPVARQILGDNLAIREMYIQLVNEHPQIVASLEPQQTARDRVLALETTIAGIQNKMFNQLTMPSQADAFALVLTIIDRNVPVSKGFEELTLDILRKEPGTKIRNDAQLSGPFGVLLSQWIVRSRMENREEVLLLTMQWSLEIGVGLAVQTIADSTDPATMATALQAISRFGGRGQIDTVLPLLNDDRTVVEQGFVRGQEATTTVSDVAMATIARLYNVELTEFGFPKNADHPILSFDINQIGFPKNEDAARGAARKKIDELLQSKSAKRRVNGSQ